MVSHWITAAQDLSPSFVDTETFSGQVIKQLGYVLSLETAVHPHNQEFHSSAKTIAFFLRSEVELGLVQIMSLTAKVCV